MSFLRCSSFFGVIAVAACSLFFVSCDNGGGGGNSSSSPRADFGSNDTNTILCIGDSITEGTCVPAGAPYPSRLGSLTGKNAINSGVCGERSDTTAGRAPGELAADQPAYLCLLIGANDAIHSYDQNFTGENIRSIIRAAKAQKTVPLVATLLPMVGQHAVYNSGADTISSTIRTVVQQEGAVLVDLEKEFGTDQSLLQADGLHPSDSGNQLIAMAFRDKIKH